MLINNLLILSKENNALIQKTTEKISVVEFAAVFGLPRFNQIPKQSRNKCGTGFGMTDYLVNTNPTFSLTFTLIVSPSTKLLASNSCERGLIRYFCITLFNGRAP